MTTQIQFVGPWKDLQWHAHDRQFRDLFEDGSKLSISGEGAFYTLAWHDRHKRQREISGLTAEGLTEDVQEARLGVRTELETHLCSVTLSIHAQRPTELKGTIELADSGFGDRVAGTFVAEADPPIDQRRGGPGAV